MGPTLLSAEQRIFNVNLGKFSFFSIKNIHWWAVWHGQFSTLVIQSSLLLFSEQDILWSYEILVPSWLSLFCISLWAWHFSWAHPGSTIPWNLGITLGYACLILPLFSISMSVSIQWYTVHLSTFLVSMFDITTFQHITECVHSVICSPSQDISCFYPMCRYWKKKILQRTWKMLF